MRLPPPPPIDKEEEEGKGRKESLEVITETAPKGEYPAITQTDQNLT
jgi:hypothetical protein